MGPERHDTRKSRSVRRAPWLSVCLLVAPLIGCTPDYETAHMAEALETTGSVSITEQALGEAWDGRTPLGLLERFTVERPHLEVRWFADDTQLYFTWWNPMTWEPASRQLLRFDVGFQPVAVEAWEAHQVFVGGNDSDGRPMLLKLDLGRFDYELEVTAERLMARVTHITDMACTTGQRLVLLDTTARTVSLFNVETSRFRRLLDAGTLPAVSEMLSLSVEPIRQPGNVNYLLSRASRQQIMLTGTSTVDMILRDHGDDGSVDAFEVH